jgi:CheY-like chemotaxis protein
MAEPDGEEGTDYFTALLRALRSEPMERRSALALIAAEGLTPDEAGNVLGQDGAAVQQLADAARDAVLAATQGQGARILIAEDERIAAFELREVLRGFGHKVVAVTSTPEEALSRAKADLPDLALVDVRLRGGSDGIGAMRAMHVALGTPAIIVTAFGDQRGRAGGAEPEDGCYGFLQKPWGAAELRAAVVDALIRIAAERLARRHDGAIDAA